MSGIAGIIYRHGKPVDQFELDRMLASIAHRGPDGSGTWRDGSVGLGHCMLWTTPESLHEHLPLADPTGHFVITADARIDNREELIAILGLDDRPVDQITDSLLILEAYKKWGEHCPVRLLGDFAFAIWDARDQKLFCARDHFGIRPFYYYQSDKIFVFGSEAKSILLLAEVPRQLNELKVGYYLAMFIDDNSITFFKDILRLPPAHSVTTGRTKTKLRNYWSLSLSHNLILKSDEQYAEAFLEILVESVRCRLRSAYPVGTLLSGGLDSSAVAGLANRLLAKNGNKRLSTVSAIYDKIPECDEREFINIILNSGDFEPHFIKADEFSPLIDFERIFWYADEPLSSPTFYIGWLLYREANKNGIRILLDGMDGDTAISHGNGYLAELARAGNWDVFAQEAKAIARHENMPTVASLFQAYGLPYVRELAHSGRWVSYVRNFYGLTSNFDIPRRRVIWNYGLKHLIPETFLRLTRKLNGLSTPAAERKPIIDRNFARSVKLDEHIQAISGHRSAFPQSARQEHFDVLTSGSYPYAFELANRASTAFLGEARHPFADKRLVEYCLALPSEQKLHKGWNRIIMRRALDGILPKEIQWRGGKTINSPAFTYGFLEYENNLLKEVVMSGFSCIVPYVNLAALRETYYRYLSQKNLSDEIVLWQVLTLSLWLKQTKFA